MSASPDNERLRAVVTGRVQGVGFRYFIQGRARALRLDGWVRNLRSGDLEFVAEGSRGDLEELMRSARAGPPMSWVEGARVTWSEARGDLTRFDVKHTI